MGHYHSKGVGLDSGLFGGMCFIKINAKKQLFIMNISPPFIDRQKPSSSRHTPSPIHRSSLFRMRLVILLPTASENKVA